MNWRATMALLGFLVAMKAADTPVQAHLGRGVELMQQHLYEAAARELEQAVAADPALAPARYQYAVCLFALGRNDEARRQFEKLAGEGDTAPELAYYLGRLDLLENNAASAIRRLRPITDRVPQAAYYLGLAYSSAGDNTAAVQWLERAARANPSDYRVHYRLARLYSASGQADRAQREYKLYNEGQNAHKGTEAEARECNSALASQPAEAARAVCRRMFDPNDPEKLVLLAQLLGEHGDFNDAVEPLERATKLDPGSFDAWHDLGLTFFRLQRYPDARAPLEKAVALRPDYFDSLNLLGATLYMLGDDRAALPVLERAHRLNPADAQLSGVLEKLRQTAKPQ